MKDRKILLAVTGGIAAYKAADLVRLFVKAGADVRVAMTKAAREFVGPLTFQALTGHGVACDLFDPAREAEMEHIMLARFADAVVVAPASANIIAKAAHGIADDLVTTLLLAARSPVLFCPAMNTHMYTHPATAANLATLRARANVFVMEPGVGELACGDEGPGRLPEPAAIFEATRRILGPRDLEGRRILVTAGPTQEPIDPVRFLSNRSTGRMGFAIAAAAAERGANVVLVAGPTSLSPPARCDVVSVSTTSEMRDAVLSRIADLDAVIKAAAPTDYRATRAATSKIKKTGGALTLNLSENPDILMEIRAAKKKSLVVVGFAAETDNVIDNARAKLERKGLDLCVANQIGEPGAGFASETNRVTFVDAGGSESLPLLSKTEVAHRILDRVASLLAKKVAGH
jgi:phosphopantothenoylcysteine decarboxylase/phosphopantothenate--cysteine ligase